MANYVCMYVTKWREKVGCCCLNGCYENGNGVLKMINKSSKTKK